MNARLARITQGGRLVLPASIRRDLKLADGDAVMLETQGSTLHITSLRDRLEAVKDACAEALGGGNLVDEFLQDRRREAAQDRA